MKASRNNKKDKLQSSAKAEDQANRERRASRIGEIESRTAPFEAGSIEQHLDMCETVGLRGDEIEHDHGVLPPDESRFVERPGVDQMMEERYQVDMSERDREGDEMSGDEHSAGLQGGEQEIEGQPHIETGLPGDETFHDQEREAGIRALGRRKNTAA